MNATTDGTGLKGVVEIKWHLYDAKGNYVEVRRYRKRRGCWVLCRTWMDRHAKFF